MEDVFDLLILGSGSTAFAAALTAQELRKTVVMTEERPIGGTCVNRGCLPSKNPIAAAKLLYDAQNPRFAGLKLGGRLGGFTLVPSGEWFRKCATTLNALRG